MAWYYPKGACGHDLPRINLIGKHTLRQWRLDRMSEQDCPDCRLKAAVDISKSEGLPLITGSAKQIAWATDIRSKLLRDLDSLAKLAEVEDREALMAIRLITDEVRARTDARWWIDRHWFSARDLITEARRAVASAVGKAGPYS